MLKRKTIKRDCYYYPGFRNPKSLVGYVFWIYAEPTRCIRTSSNALYKCSHESIREWSLTFGTYANEIKRRVLRRGDKWHMDEMCFGYEREET